MLTTLRKFTVGIFLRIHYRESVDISFIEILKHVFFCLLSTRSLFKRNILPIFLSMSFLSRRQPNSDHSIRNTPDRTEPLSSPSTEPFKQSPVSRPRSSGSYTYIQHFKHQPASLQNSARSHTPRPLHDSDGIPEGLLNTESGQLSASLSLAPTRYQDERIPRISAVDLVSVDSSSPSFSVCIGDTMGWVENLETRDPSKFFRKHSHRAFVGEFDCLTSSTVDEKVTCIRQLHPTRSPGMTVYLASNERTIKLFRIRSEQPSFSQLMEQSVNEPTSASQRGSIRSYQSGMFSPRSDKRVTPVKAFMGSHKGPIQNLSVCADGETFLSMDDLQVFWWSVECTDSPKPTCIADLTPSSGKMDDVTQLLTVASFHPWHASLFLVGRSNGQMSIGDLRDPPSRHSRQYSVNFQMLPEHNLIQHDEHNDILISISSASFLGNHNIVSRDFLSLKLWDDRNPSRPVSSCGVMEFLSPHLDELYDSDSIFDRFPVAIDAQSGTVVTGLYNGTVALWEPLRQPNALEYYETDPYVPPSESENGGWVSRRHVAGVFEFGLGQEQANRKVMNLAISSGGDRFCCCTTDHFFVFRRNSAV